MKNIIFFILISLFLVSNAQNPADVAQNFGSFSGFDNLVNSVVIQNDGKVILGGAFTSFNGLTENRIIRLNPDGTRDNSFNTGTGFDGGVNSIIIQNDEKILIGGSFISYNGINQNGIIRLNTDGLGLMYEKAYMKTPKLANFFSIEVNEKRHTKEQKKSLQIPAGGFTFFGTPYVYGKRNSFYQLKLSYGQQRMIGGKTNKNGVAIYSIYGGGLAVGLERPYYVRVVDNGGPDGTRDIKYSTADSAAFLAPGNIVSGTGLRKGWGEMKVVPGVHAKAALRFDYGRFNETVAAIEIGLNIEAYSRKVEIMLLNPSQQVFFNGYISLLFGKRK